jgi:ApaG protein
VPTSDRATRGIRVRVESRFVEARSNLAEGQWFFAYTITIANESELTVQLISRHWVITDANGVVREIRGPGVVGKQPILEPGDSFEYTSFCPLTTSFGTMHGSYQMAARGSESFDAEIAPFALGEPYSIN